MTGPSMTFPQAVHFVIIEGTRFVTPIGLAAEWIVLAIVVALVFSALTVSPRLALKIRDSFGRLAERKRLSIMGCAAIPVIIRLSMLGFAPVPDPSIHDEFSHLLLGDTLAHGRLTNRTHPMWRHFESIHVIQKPTYNSMYLPAQGSFLAFGQAVFHEPWAGVELSVGLMFAAICWMLQGWLPPRWALFGTAIAILKIGVVGFWVNSYMGGSVPAIGGALLIGAIPRLRSDDSSTGDALLLGLGAVVLMYSRPFEGGVLTLAACAFLVPSFLRRLSENAVHTIRMVVVPAAVVFACGALFLGYYCWRVTGHPFRMPYQVNRDTYGWPENLAFLKPKEISSTNPVLLQMHRLEVHHRDIYTAPDRLIDNLVTRLFDNWAYLIGPMLTIPLLLPFFRPERSIRPLLAFLTVIMVLNLFQMLLYPYHLAPVVPIIFGIVAAGSRRIYAGLLDTSVSRAVCLAVLLPSSLVLVAALKQESPQLDIPFSSYWERGYELHRDARAWVTQWLNARPGKHLIMVRYAPYHPVDQEWVYNGADINGSKIVWARELDEDSNADLLRYFRDREVWLLEADKPPPRVVPYTAPDSVSQDLKTPEHQQHSNNPGG